MAKISSKKECQKMETNSTLKKILLLWDRNAELLRLVGAIFDSKVVSLKTMRKKNLIILKSLQKKGCHFGLHLSLLTFELLNINSKCSENCNMLTEGIHDSVVFRIFLNIITICVFIE